MSALTKSLILSALAFASNVGSAQQTPAPQPQAAPGLRFEKTVPTIISAPWQGQRISDGQPEIQGHWSNTIANHNNWTDPQGGVPDDRSRANRQPGPREQRAPSRVTDPADGHVPFQPWALALQQEFLAHFPNPVKPQYIEPLARCAPGGVPKSFIWHGYEIRQYPGYVLFLFDSGTRIVHLDGKPPLPENIKLWNADSRGRWEGNTLIVRVSNNNAKARFGRTGEFASENVQIEERFIFDNDGQRYNYVATFTDPTVYTQPWTATIPARRYTLKQEPDEWHFAVALANAPGREPLAERYERICVENNGGFGNVAVAPKQ